MRMMTAMVMCGVAAVGAGGCSPIETHNTVVIEQPKPLEVNVNLSGRLELVITDARKDMETIQGEKPKREVKPEDIGLPATGVPGAAGTEEEDRAVVLADVIAGARVGTPQPREVAASEEDLVKSMAARNAQVRKLLSAHVAGEAHTGLLVEKGTLTADQKGTVEAENADRQALYKLRAAKTGTSEADAALAYYLQRLGYAEKGDWVEKYNKATKQWEWVKWGE
ncbi:MAG TPA: DUF1318 domain-containing protein [Phycisphaerae bacterium]|nr:DUF1318 domain-containing protein [Phycisphaerae bacterium]